MYVPLAADTSIYAWDTVNDEDVTCTCMPLTPLAGVPIAVTVLDAPAPIKLNEPFVETVGVARIGVGSNKCITPIVPAIA